MLLAVCQSKEKPAMRGYEVSDKTMAFGKWFRRMGMNFVPYKTIGKQLN